MSGFLPPTGERDSPVSSANFSDLTGIGFACLTPHTGLFPPSVHCDSMSARGKSSMAKPIIFAARFHDNGLVYSSQFKNDDILF